MVLRLEVRGPHSEKRCSMSCFLPTPQCPTVLLCLSHLSPVSTLSVSPSAALTSFISLLVLESGTGGEGSPSPIIQHAASQAGIFSPMPLCYNLPASDCDALRAKVETKAPGPSTWPTCASAPLSHGECLGIFKDHEVAGRDERK